MDNRLTQLLGVKYPIILAPMAWVCLPSLVAAVSNAGGLGILGAAPMSPQELQYNVREIRRLTDKPFGVNFVPDSPQLEELLDVIVDEKVPVVSYGIGDPRRIIERTKPRGLINLPTIGAVRHAERAQSNGADAVIAQGHEGGGHNAPISTMVLLPLLSERLSIPVVAAGGIADGRGFASALALGAEGIAMGTRFIATRESPVPQKVKEFLLQATEEDTTITGHLTGLRCRVLKNRLTKSFEELGQAEASSERYVMLGIGTFRLAMVDGDIDNGSVAAGQCAGLINDIPSCQELIQRIVAEAVFVSENMYTQLNPERR